MLNSFFPFIVGIVLKKMKIRVAAFICCGVLALGGFIQAFSGVFAGDWNTTTCFVIFLLGRLVFYSGSDALLVIKSKLNYII